MTFSTRLQLGLLTAAVLAIAWQFQQRMQFGRQLAAVEREIQLKRQELAVRGAELATMEQRNAELEEAERRAGNQTLISLMRERAAATATAQDSRTHAIGNALADVLDNPEQREIDREYLRNEMKANLGPFFKTLNLPAEKVNQYIDLNIEFESRKADRLAALLRGKMTLADALLERDKDFIESQARIRAVLGEEGYAFLQSIADGMRSDEAERTIQAIQHNMGDNKLNQEQSERLKALIKAQIAELKLDDTDLFRSPEDWETFYAQHQELVLKQAVTFLTPTQMEMIRTLAALDLADKKAEMIRKRKAHGIN